ncbi:MAG: hypothetical protein IPF87_18220 [Gemmatimonadetes bacterium]|nr:hypothetical protein [Gemmatimonadota bacterium]
MNDTLNALGQVRRRAIALLGVVFVTGGLAGIAIDRLALRPDRVAATMQLPAGGPPFGGPPVGGGSVRMTLPPYLEALGLDSAQRAAAIAIVERVRPRIDSATRQTVPLMRAVTDSAS